MTKVPESKKKKIHWSAEKVMSTSALFVSVISVIALFYQLSLSREENELMRQQQSASVLPHLRLSYTYTPDLWQISFLNKGVGPAFVKEVEFSIEDTLKFERSDFWANHVIGKIHEGDSTSIRMSTYSFMQGDILSANEEIDILTIRDEPGIRAFRQYLNSVNWGFSVVYEDIYGTRWKLSSESTFPVKLSQD